MTESAGLKDAAFKAAGQFDGIGSLVGQSAYNALTNISNPFENNTTNLALNLSGPITNMVKTGIGMLTKSSDSDSNDKDQFSLIPENYSEYLSEQRKQAAGQFSLNDITSDFQQKSQNILDQAKNKIFGKNLWKSVKAQRKGGCLRKKKYQSGGWIDLANQGLNIASQITDFALNKKLDKYRTKFQKISNNMQYPMYNYYQNNITPKPYDLGSMPINS